MRNRLLQLIKTKGLSDLPDFSDPMDKLATEPTTAPAPPNAIPPTAAAVRDAIGPALLQCHGPPLAPHSGYDLHLVRKLPDFHRWILEDDSIFRFIYPDVMPQVLMGQTGASGIVVLPTQSLEVSPLGLRFQACENH